MKKWSDEDLRIAVAANITIAGVLRQLGLSSSPGNYRTVKKYIKKLELSTEHHRGKAHGTTKTGRPLQEILVLGSYIGSTALKRKILREGLLPVQCAHCPTKDEWQGKPLVLQLDHINGNPVDNRLENLRLLCPNCHSQTSTYKGRGSKGLRYNRERHTCLDCGTIVSRDAKRCSDCGPKAKEKIQWPPAQEVVERVITSSYVAVAKELEVSDNAVRKFLKRKLGHVPK